METDSISTIISSSSSGLDFLPFTIGTLFAIIINLCLLLLSALISGSEVAYFSLEPSDLKSLKENQSKKNKLVLSHLKNKETLLATILISNNFVNVAIVILTSFVAATIVDFGEDTIIKFVFEVIFITGIILFFGEILPKVYASQYPRKFAGFMAYPLMVLTRILKPLSIVLTQSTSIVNRRIAKKVGSLSMDDISQALELTGSDISEEKDILEGIVKFGNIDVSEIMTARVDVIDVEIKSNYNKVLQVIIDSGYSRIPVFEETPDNVKGILYVKDLLAHLDEGPEFEWQSLIRKAYYVPETKMINDLLEEFQAQKIHMAIVVDEYGGTMGIVTLEDILEEIVGDISDELDDDEEYFTRMPDGSIVFEAKVLLNDFHKITETDEELFAKVRGEAETLAGLILELKGQIPQKNDVIKHGDCVFTIVAADNRRIKKVKFEIKK
ncbi:gliding motility-associated protein GldE [Carboxylicivirga sediminis]|uniref:Gliding motility-associated protein GldE n=1 Tax=Carboxylicivirga sediminis TaxID=2006564 RepID=A0A941F110_9BACT|nr:gliding motility-associated protein GldE [Carboxylicivirga sediminis]MBR8534821.1 gliding motility-associated protein GldE [Carboxylicivirga sediminis]